MKIAGTVARYLLGLMFFVFGLNSFLQFIPQGPPMPGNAGVFVNVLMAAHYFYGVGTVMAVNCWLTMPAARVAARHAATARLCRLSRQAAAKPEPHNPSNAISPGIPCATSASKNMLCGDSWAKFG